MNTVNDIRNGMIVGAIMGTMIGTAIGVTVKMKRKPCSPMKKNLHKACCVMENVIKSMSDMTK